MHILHVSIRVKPECLDAFKAATLANARASRQEPGIARFDVVQNADDPARFMLLEVYRSPAGHVAHRETAHYATWRDAVAPMMAEPRTATKFINLFPDDAGW
jgi:(4S)-4-hydroxy-5-phosphonooxypentane-2,3-dione isomerase